MGPAMRRLTQFACAGETLFATLDCPDAGADGEARGNARTDTGLLIVSGGNEIRVGAHRGMAELAHRLATECGVPVWRFDRRGVGDSTGENHGYADSGADIAAAAAAFRREVPWMRHIVGFGNCDAATALALFHAGAGIDGLILANPWTGDEEDALPPAAAIRARYAARIADPRQWRRLLSGGIDIGKLVRGLAKAAQDRGNPADPGLVERMGAALVASPAPLTFLLARADNTAIAFEQAWEHSPALAPLHGRARVNRLDSASHSFAAARDARWLFEQVAQATGE